MYDITLTVTSPVEFGLPYFLACDVAGVVPDLARDVFAAADVEARYAPGAGMRVVFLPACLRVEVGLFAESAEPLTLLSVVDQCHMNFGSTTAAAWRVLSYRNFVAGNLNDVGLQWTWFDYQGHDQAQPGFATTGGRCLFRGASPEERLAEARRSLHDYVARHPASLTKPPVRDHATGDSPP